LVGSQISKIDINSNTIGLNTAQNARRGEMAWMEFR
jgi:hypothetical protein